MGPFLVARLLVVLGLLPGLSPLKTPTIGKSCTCHHPDIARHMPNDSLPDDTFHVDTSMAISCCKDLLLGYHDPGASVQWSFNGEDYSENWDSSFRTSTFCGNETIKTTSGKVTDGGEYSCTITATNGTSKTFTMKMTVEHKSEHRDEPRAIKSSPNVVAQLEDKAVFTCESYVGTNDTKKHGVNVGWIKYFPNHTLHVFANTLPNVNVTKVSGSGRSWGMIKGQLVISSIQEIHFGIYECTVSNYYGAISIKMSLTDGIPEPIARMLRHRTMTVVVASLLGVVVVVVLGCYRWHRLLRLCWRHGTPSSEEHQYDVFLVHGDSATRWVWSILLPALEDFGYTCFLPQRDMCGGSMVAESILEALKKCRRVVVVITPCLLDSPWATWATYSGIQTALTSSTRILALVHKKQRFMSGSLDQNPLLKVLKLVRKIKMPEELAWDILCEDSPQQQPDTSTSKQETKVQKTELKLILPEINVSISSSNSLPKSQRLSNMISASTTVSREDLECKKDSTTEVGGPAGEDQGLQDPGSPSSVTPFIWSSRRKPLRPSSSDSVCQFIGRCLQMVCIGDPEEQFWQTLRLHIGPRSLSRATPTDK